MGRYWLRKRIWLCFSLNKTQINHINKCDKYHLIKEMKTWQKAQSYCRENHTDLVSGLKQLQDGELKEVMESVREENPNEPYIYFGLFRDTWRWSDGSSFSFRHWKNELNNQQSNSGLCAMTVFDDEGRWKNENCTIRKPFICYDGEKNRVIWAPL
uniref:C-type lectin domain-containing protein n=1 Tax=Fundulus heteroclitus TaxID=8078 RepID=A0A3Q2NWW4_FUNHE